MNKTARFAALALAALFLITACSAFAAAEAAVEDGLYTVGVNSSSDMFKVVKCVLNVEGGAMTGTLTMSGTGYGYLYPGTGEEAAQTPAEDWIPCVKDFEDRHTFAMPIEALDRDMAVAAYSIKKEKWYDRTLRFTSATLAPTICVAPDGNYSAKVESDAGAFANAACNLSVKGGEMTAKISCLPSGVTALDFGNGAIAARGGRAEFRVPSLDQKMSLRVLEGESWNEYWLRVPSAGVVSAALTCADGVYTADVKSDSGLFRVSACTLRANGGAMRADLTVGNGNYDYLYVGSAADALNAESAWNPIVLGENGAYTLTMNVETLDNPIRVATHSPSKDMWYDRELTFLSETLQPSDDALSGGECAPDGFAFSGGTGKVTISCEKLTVSEGKATARIVFSSAKYAKVSVDGAVFEAVKTDETASFDIPVRLNTDMEIIATTTAMSKARDIVYTIRVSLDDASSADGEAPAIAGLTYQGAMPLRYAERFRVFKYEGGYALIEITDGERVLVVPENGEIPESLPADVMVLQKPIQNIYLAATSAMALFDSLGALDAIRLTGTDAPGWYIENAKAAMEKGDILFAGKYSEPDFELLLRENCGLAIESTMILHSPNVREMIELLKIPVLVDRSSYEPHPLGRTEWIKLYGALVGKEEKAAAFFDGQAAILDSAEGFEATGKTVAFFYIASDGSVMVRNKTDYVSKMIALAGGVNAFEGVVGADETRSSVPISMEDFYKAAVDADILIYNATIDEALFTVEELLQKSDMIADFKAVGEGNVWCTGKYLYQATDIIGSLIGDFRAILTGDESDLIFLNKIH